MKRLHSSQKHLTKTPEDPGVNGGTMSVKQTLKDTNINKLRSFETCYRQVRHIRYMNHKRNELALEEMGSKRKIGQDHNEVKTKILQLYHLGSEPQQQHSEKSLIFHCGFLIFK